MNQNPYGGQNQYSGNPYTAPETVADYGDIGPRALHHIALLGEPTRDASGTVIG